MNSILSFNPPIITTSINMNSIISFTGMAKPLLQEPTPSPRHILTAGPSRRTKPNLPCPGLSLLCLLNNQFIRLNRVPGYASSVSTILIYCKVFFNDLSSCQHPFCNSILKICFRGAISISLLFSLASLLTPSFPVSINRTSPTTPTSTAISVRSPPEDIPRSGTYL